MAPPPGTVSFGFAPVPRESVSVGVPGIGVPVAHAFKWTVDASGAIPVKVNAYPSATGIPGQGPVGTTKERVTPGDIRGPPKGPGGFRVSTSVQRTVDTTCVAEAGNAKINASAFTEAPDFGGATVRRRGACASSVGAINN